MTERLDRIEAILAQVAESQQRTQAICESNARAIQAWETRIEDGIADAEEVSTSMAASTNEQLSSSIADTVAMIGDLGRQQGQMMQQQAETDQRFNVLLEENRTDRKEWRQKFDEQIAQMQSDRLSHANRFQAMQEILQSHLLEIQRLARDIQRIWQRIAG